MRFGGLFALAVSLALMGCAQLQFTQPASTSFQMAPTKGVVIGSVTYAKSAADVRALYVMKRPEEKFGALVDTDNDDFPKDSSVQGTLFVFQLEPGEYSVDSWQLISSNWAAGQRVISPVQPERRAFTVKPGQVTYIGNIHMEYALGSLGSSPAPTAGRPEIKDMSERDIPMVRHKYAALASVDIQKGVLPTGPWRSAGQRSGVNRTVAY